MKDNYANIIGAQIVGNRKEVAHEKIGETEMLGRALRKQRWWSINGSIKVWKK